MTNKVKIGVIDVTPEWRGVLGLLLMIYESGSPEGRAGALEELNRMAAAADHLVALQKEAGAVKVTIRAFSENDAAVFVGGTVIGRFGASSVAHGQNKTQNAEANARDWVVKNGLTS